MRDFNELVDDFSFLDDWEDRYRYVIELGRELSELEDSQRIEANKVHGCASQVWLITDVDTSSGQPVLNFRGDSDAMIVKGLIAILISIYSGKSAGEILNTDAFKMLAEIDLQQNLTQQRSNGLQAMVQRIHATAAEAQAA
ncbi:MAG: SufE family protein [Rhizobiales bacterium]|nr:SufE family protein [Hyphomicrobiales bacterium]